MSENQPGSISPRPPKSDRVLRSQTAAQRRSTSSVTSDDATSPAPSVDSLLDEVSDEDSLELDDDISIPLDADESVESDDEDETEYEVEQILEKKIENGETMYLLHWVGYPQSESTWEPEENLTQCQNMLTAFNKSWNEKRIEGRKSRAASGEELTQEASDTPKKREAPADENEGDGDSGAGDAKKKKEEEEEEQEPESD